MTRRLVVLVLGLGLIGLWLWFYHYSNRPLGNVPARRTLGPERMGPERVPELIEALKSGQASAADFDFDKLNLAAARAAVPGLIAALKDKDAPIRRVAVKVLSDYLSSRDMAHQQIVPEASSAVPALIAALNDQDAEVRLVAIQSLVPPENRPSPGEQPFFPGTPSNVSVFAEALKNDDPQVRRWAAYALGVIGPPAKKAVPALTARIGDPEMSVRLEVTRALTKIGQPAVPALIQALHHEDPGIFIRVAGALAEIGSPAEEAIPELKQTSQRQEPLAAAWSLYALTMIDRKNHPPQQAVQLLIEILKTHRDSQVRDLAAMALGRIGPEAKDAVPLLAEAIQSEKVCSRDAAFFALGKMGPGAKEAIPALVQAMHTHFPGTYLPNFRAVEALGDIGPAAQEATPDLIKALQDKKLDRQDGTLTLRHYSAEALGKIGPAETVVPVLIDALHDDERMVPRYAAKGLRALGPAAKAAIPELTKVMWDEKAWARLEAADALAAMGDDGRTALTQAAESESPGVKAIASYRLEKMTPKAK